MARLNDLGKVSGSVVTLPIENIVVREGFNFRDVTTEAAQRHIEWLMQSIREKGVQEPIRVQFEDGQAVLVNGQCRYIAVKRLNEEEGLDIRIPALSIKGDEANILASSMIANGGLPPTLLEFGKALERLQSYGWSLEQASKYAPATLAATPSKALKVTKDALELHQAPIAVKEAVAHGIDGVEISPALAVAVTRESRAKAPEVLREHAAKAKAEGQTVARRPKGEGVAAKAKAAVEDQITKERRLGDWMAQLILAENTEWDSLQESARQWNKARGIK